MNRIFVALGVAAAFAAALVLVPAGPAGAAAPPQDVLRATLDNGLRVVVVRDPVGPVVTTEMNYLVGSVECPPGFPGLAHAQEHMLFRGSPGLSGDQISDISAELGGAVNADTRPTVTQYHFTVPADDLDIALRVEATRMRAVNDDPADWERERGAIEQEVSNDDSNPLNSFARALQATAFAGTPYAQDGLGTRGSFDKTTASMLRDFYQSWYGPNNAILVIAGDVDPPAALAQVKSLFASIPRRPTPPRPDVVLRPLHHATVRMEARFPYKVTFISYRLPGYDSPDFLAGQLLIDVLQSKRSAIAALAVKGVALDAEFDQDPPLPKASLATLVALARPDADDAPMIDALHRVMDDYATSGVPAELVEAAKKRELVEATEDRSSVPLVAQAWSEALAVGGRASPDDDVNALASVTVDDVNRVAHEYLAPDLAIESVPIAPTRHESSQGGGESVVPSDVAPVALPTWAATKLLSLRAPSTLTAAQSRVLPNGIRLIVQPEPANQSVEIVGDVRNTPEVETPPGQEGIAEVENDLFDYGTTGLDRDQFQAAIDALGADETAGTHFSVKLLSSDFDRGMQLLADAELHPAFPADAFRIVQRRVEGVANGRANSAAYQTHRALDRELYPLFDPVLRETTSNSVLSLSLDDVKRYYAKTFRPDLATIVVIGDVTTDQAYAEVEKWFGDWSAAGGPPAVELPSVPQNDPATSVLSPPGDLQDNVSMSETLDVLRSSDDYYALQLGNELLGGATLASRLYQDLREERGLVYFVGTQLDLGKTRSTFTVRFGCDPGNTSHARAIVRGDLQAMQSSAVSADALQRAKALLLRRIPLRQESQDAIADGLLDDAEAGLPLNEPALAAAHYISLSASDVTRAFARWIRPDGFAQVVVGPYPQ